MINNRFIINFKTLSPISHILIDSDNQSNQKEFNKIKLANGEEINIISGNAIRGNLRNIIMNDFFKKIEMNFNNFQKYFSDLSESKRQWDKIYSVFFHGGALSGNQINSINPEYFRKLRKLIVPLSLLGSACFSFMLDGMCNIGIGYLLSKETIENDLIYGFSDFDKYNDDLMELLTFTRHTDDEETNKTQEIKNMIYNVNCIRTGSIIQTVIDMHNISNELEKYCLINGILNLQTLGGKIGAGLGRVKMININLNESQIETATNEYNNYLNNLKDNKEFIDFFIEFAKGL